MELINVVVVIKRDCELSNLCRTLVAIFIKTFDLFISIETNSSQSY